MRNKILLIITLFCFSGSVVLAQDTVSHHIPIEFSFESSFFAFNNLSDLNSRLKVFKYPGFSNYAARFSGIISPGNINTPVSSFYEFDGVLPVTYTMANDIHVSLSTIGFTANISCNLNYKKGVERKILFKPYLGVGFSWASLSLRPQANNSQSFDSTIAIIKGQREVTTNTTYLVNMGMLVQKLISKENGCYVGIRAGYELALNHPSWQFNNIVVSKTNMGGFYVGLQLSFLSYWPPHY